MLIVFPSLQDEVVEELISQGTLVGDTTGNMLLDRRELGTRRSLDASMTTSFVPALLVNGRVPWCSLPGAVLAIVLPLSHNDVETSISGLLTIGRGLLGDGLLLPFYCVTVVFVPQLP